MIRNIFLVLLAGLMVQPVLADEAATGSQDAALKSLIERIRPSIATIKVTGRDGDRIAIGTGFVVDANGLVATNHHVIGEGRPFTVEMSSGRALPVAAVEASDRRDDLVLLRVDVGDQPLPALKLSDDGLPAQGARVLAFGNPLGFRDSVVIGIVSAVREVEGRQMIQLAIPIEPGNSGGPLVDMNANVRGIINMKSAIKENLGFAIPVENLSRLVDRPNPVTMDRWVRLSRIDDGKWTPLFGATWQQRGGLVTARGSGDGFGGRSLCLSKESTMQGPMEIAVQVRLDDESGAAGIAFHSNGKHRHYGFYPSNGRLRLTCFKGPTVYSWQVLEEVESQHYIPNHWNRLRVRIEPGKLKCFVNGHLAIESTDGQLTSGQFGLVKFRDTNPDFKGFAIGANLGDETLGEEAKRLLDDVLAGSSRPSAIERSQMSLFGKTSGTVSRELSRKAMRLESQAARLRRLASDVELVVTLDELTALMAEDGGDVNDSRLLRGALLIGKLDNPDIDVDAYQQRVDEMAAEIRADVPHDADETQTRNALHRYLFEENGFHGGRAEYYHPANSHLSRVIDDREGLPITLSILYMELAKRIDLIVEGVGLPGHFVVRHVTDDGEQLIDVFERGQLLSEVDARQIVASFARREMTAADTATQSDKQILVRVLNNLVGVASRNQDPPAIHRYCEALVAITPDSVQARLLRSQILAMTDRIPAAIKDLDWLIDNQSPRVNHAELRQLRQALIQRQQSE